jgi:hypothetical protein
MKMKMQDVVNTTFKKMQLIILPSKFVGKTWTKNLIMKIERLKLS